MKLFFIPGLFGPPQDVEFCAPLFEEVVVFDHLAYQADRLLDQLEESLEVEKPDVIYAYSMGGRLLLSLYQELSFTPKNVFLESVGLERLHGEERARRYALDQTRAKALKSDFESFIKSWYELPLWQLNTDELREMMDSKLGLKDKVSQLSELIEVYSPGHFPREDFAYFDEIFYQCEEMVYLAGEKDIKYRNLALELSQRAPERVRIIGGAGHNIHFQKPKKVDETISQFLPIL